MNLLAIDASSDNLSLAILKNNQITFDYNRRIKFGASRLPANIDRALKKTKLKLENLDAFVLGGGPGSFTGLRIGLAAIKGMAFGLKIPVMGVPTLDPVAAFQPLADKPMMVVLQAGRKRLAKVDYSSSSKLCHPQEAAATGLTGLL